MSSKSPISLNCLALLRGVCRTALLCQWKFATRWCTASFPSHTGLSRAFGCIEPASWSCVVPSTFNAVNLGVFQASFLMIWFCHFSLKFDCGSCLRSLAWSLWEVQPSEECGLAIVFPSDVWNLHRSVTWHEH